MEVEIKRLNPRRLTSLGKKEPTIDEVVRHFTLIVDDLRKEIVTLAESVPGNIRNTVKVTVPNDVDAVIEVANPLGYVPAKWKVVDQDGTGQLYRTKRSNWSSSKLFFQASEGTEAGTVFEVMLFGRK